MLLITVCPVCLGKVETVRKDWIGHFQGQSYVVRDLVYYVCQECGECIFPRETIKKIQAHSPAYPHSKVVSETNLNFLHYAQDEEIDFSDIPEITEEQMTNANIRIGGQVAQTQSTNRQSFLE